MNIKNLYSYFFTLLISSFVWAQEPTELKEPYATSPNERVDAYLPSPVSYQSNYDPLTGMYTLQQYLGEVAVGAPLYLSLKEYTDLLLKQQIEDNYRSLNQDQDDALRNQAKTVEERVKEGKKLIPNIKVNNKIFETIFGGNEITFTPRGYISIDLGIYHQKIDNPQLLPQNRSSFAFDIDPRFQFGVEAKIGERFALQVAYDNAASFSFDNKINLAWDGDEDNIVKRVEFGNVSLPLSTSLISGAQSLFGAKVEMQFGKTWVTTVLSEQQSESRRVQVNKGGVLTNFKLSALDYDENQHYFLSHYFRERYDDALKAYPFIDSKINISRLEVWIIDKGNSDLENQKSLVAFRDLGGNSTASTVLPSNGAIYSSLDGMKGIRDFSQTRNLLIGSYEEGEEFVTHGKVRKLKSTEYSYHNNLGYLSLNQKLSSDQLLAVSYQYTVSGEQVPRQVGEMYNEGTEVMIAKLLKPNSSVDTESPLWDLMMKNVYSMGGYSISQEDFLFNVNYNDPTEGKSQYLPNGNKENLLQLLNMDRLNRNGDLYQRKGGKLGDGLFDFLPGLTVNAEKGKIIFTTKEPFATTIEEKTGSTDFSFTELYEQQKTRALASPFSNRYTLEGTYKGENSSGISLGAFNIPQGSVKVSMGGRELQENVDYVVDYQFGSLTIINELIKNSGQALDIQLENQAAFNLQKKTFVGINVEHRFSDDFVLGGNIIHYREKPLTENTNFGSESVKNTMFGLNTNYRAEVPKLTDWANRLMPIDSEVSSSLNINAEVAVLLPGLNNVGNQTFIDDFETSQSKISLKDPYSWSLSSTPEGNKEFPNGSAVNDLINGYGRALMSWYIIDSQFYGVGGKEVVGINDESLSKHMARRVDLGELYPRKQTGNDINTYVSTFDITIYPEEGGPYNANASAESAADRWAGITRPLTVTNFTQANINYLEFWLMDPYADGTGSEGELLIHIGNVSEDILKDGKAQYENGLPNLNNNLATKTSVWGKQPSSSPLLYSFDSEGIARSQQDVGLDGLNNTEEASVYGSSNVNPITNHSDPAADDYVYYTDSRWQSSIYSHSLVDRYRYFKGTEGNSPSSGLSAGSQYPDTEDANKDYNMDQVEKYNQYRVSISKSDLETVGSNFVVDKKLVNVKLENGTSDQVNWYQIRIPVDEFESGSLENLNSARYLRMILKGFTTTTTLRLASLDLVRSDWQIYDRDLYPSPGSEGLSKLAKVDLDLGVVNIEENEQRQPPYVLAPGLSREKIEGTSGYYQKNEQSLSLTAKNLSLGSRAVYKKVNLDLRRYKKLKMYTHAEDILNPNSSEYDEDTKIFIRLGSDYTDNYYEYEFSVKYTPKSASSVSQIWPYENFMEVDIAELVSAKQLRDSQGVDVTDRFERTLNSHKKMYVKGRPSLGEVSSIMMGIRNLSSHPKTITIWLNELTLSGIERNKGYAARTSVQFNMADLANVQLSGSYTSVDFGGLDSSPAERSQDSRREYAIASNVNVDKLLPEKWNRIKLPLSLSYGESIQAPKYNPLDSDVELDEAYNKETIRKVASTKRTNRSIGLNGLRIEKPEHIDKPRLLGLENFQLSFNYSDSEFNDVSTEYDINKRLNASLAYSYSNNSDRFFRPFTLIDSVKKKGKETEVNPSEEEKKTSSRKKESKLWEALQRFGLNPFPTQISFNTFLDRNYNQMKYRDVNFLLGRSKNDAYDALHSSDFNLGWNYGLGFNLTPSLKADFKSNMLRTANVASDMPDQDLIWEDLFNIGRPLNYKHNINVNWNVPTHLLPFFDWVNASVSYNGGYNWIAGSTALQKASKEKLGNVSTNNYNLSWNGSIDLRQLYGDFKGVKELEKLKEKRREEINKHAEKYGKRVNKKGKSKRKGKQYKVKNKYKAKDIGLLLLTSIKTADFSIGQTGNTILPGVLTHPNFIGLSSNNIVGPGIPFVLGIQDKYQRIAVQNNWVSNSAYVKAYQQNMNKTFSANMGLVPFEDLNINLTVNKTTGKTYTHSGFNVDSDTSLAGFQSSYGTEIETYNISTLSLGSTFRDSKDLYRELKSQAAAISRAKGGTINSDGYAEGYGISSSEILVPAFLSTFTGRSNKGGFKSNIPLPNWTVNYRGLSKLLPFINRYVENINFHHSYSSNYGIGTQSNLMYRTAIGKKDNNNNYYTAYTVGNVVVTESLSPLIGVDITLRNGLQLRGDYSINNIASLSMVNTTLVEDRLKTITIGAGYTFEDLKFRMRYRGQRKIFKGNLNLKADFSFTDGESRITRILKDESQLTRGQEITSIKFTADYGLTKNLNLQFFYDQSISNYKISTIYPLNTLRSGISATFTFGE